MSAFALNDSHDIDISAGQLARATGADYVVQKVTTQLRMYLGEWWLNNAKGTPWFQRILSNPADIENAESIIKRIILATPGAVELQAFSATFDATTRAFTLTFSLLTEFGPSGEVIVSA